MANGRRNTKEKDKDAFHDESAQNTAILRNEWTPNFQL